jgi:hypothetical protein
MRRLLGTVLAAALLAACAEAPPSDPRADGEQPDDLVFVTVPVGNATMQALFRGPLVVRDGCVLIGEAPDLSVPLWPEGFTAARDDAGRVVVRDADGGTVATEGATFEMGGGYVAEFEPRGLVEPTQDQLRDLEQWLGNPIPARCLGPDIYGVWSVGETSAP